MPRLLGPHARENAFNGTVTLFLDSRRPGVLGEMEWDGTMDLAQSVAASLEHDFDHPDEPIANPSAHTAVLHEMIHGTVPPRSQKANAAAYQDYATAQLEEGFTELGTIHHAPEYFERMGIADRKAVSAGQESPAGKHQTMAELARDIQDPVRIASRDGSRTWGHYPGQAADAQDWVQQVAREEGYADLRPGTDGWKRVVQLADQINEQGAAGKIETMARQMAFATVKDPKLRNDPKFMDGLMGSSEEIIHEEWGKGAEADVSPAKQAFASGRHFVKAQVAERMTSYTGSTEVQARAAETGAAGKGTA